SAYWFDVSPLARWMLVATCRKPEAVFRRGYMKPRHENIRTTFRIWCFPSTNPLKGKWTATLLAGVSSIALDCTVPATEAPAQSVQAGMSACTGGGYVGWNDLLTPETEKISIFYGNVIGWNINVTDGEYQQRPPANPENRYAIFLNGDQEVAGLMQANHPAAIHSGGGWFTYFQVADVDTAVAKVKLNGGTILRHPIETADGNRIALVSDPAGTICGLVTPAAKPEC